MAHQTQVTSVLAHVLRRITPFLLLDIPRRGLGRFCEQQKQETSRVALCAGFLQQPPGQVSHAAYDSAEGLLTCTEHFGLEQICMQHVYMLQTADNIRHSCAQETTYEMLLHRRQHTKCSCTGDNMGGKRALLVQLNLVYIGRKYTLNIFKHYSG